MRAGAAVGAGSWGPGGAWPAGQRQAQLRLYVQRLGLWIFLAAVTMLFAAFSSAYLVRRAGADWQPMALPGILWLNTVWLLGSSATLELGRLQVRRGGLREARIAVAAALLLGVAFLVGQLAAWRQLVAQGVYVQSNPHSSFFYILTGAHGLHLVAGLVLLLVAVIQIGGGAARTTSWSGFLDLCATYWHFFAALWVYLFVLLAVV